MKKCMLLWGAMAWMAWGEGSAQVCQLQPTPQEVRQTTESVAVPSRYKLAVSADRMDSPAARLLDRVLPGRAEQASFCVTMGVRGDKAVKKVDKRIPKQAEGYYLQVSDEGIVVAGADERGLYYGVQTLAQLVADGKLPVTEVTDFPDVPYRGVVEGFYGTPWSHEARLRQLDFYGRNKMNVYLYGPKDDPYHSVPNWRKPYPEKEAAQLKELVERARENEVIFYWAIHPGQDIKWNEEDRGLLLKKFECMYDLGVRAFAVFFDDISGEGTKATKQAELLNYLDDQFVKVKGDVAPLVMCPTEYNKSWSNVEGGYLTTLGRELNEGIEIMWTGDRVIACIDKQAMDFINPLLQRKAYIWWNFPVSDYVRDHLLMGRVYGNGLDIKDDLAAFVSNPMERPEASKISLYSVADYSWNLEDYDSEASWKRAVRDLMPDHAEEMELFASHHSDLGENGHGFRREESVELTPALELLLNSYKESSRYDEGAYDRVMKECEEIVYAADVLMASNSNRALIDEIRPWLMQFKQLGEYGQSVLQLMAAELEGEKVKCSVDKKACNKEGLFVKYHTHARALQNLMYQVDATYNQNPYQPGVKSGSRILLPTFHKLFEVATSRYNKAYHALLNPFAEYMPYTLQSDVSQLAMLPMRQRGKTGSVSPSNEVIMWQAGGQVSVTMDYVRTLRYLVIDLGSIEAASHFKVELTADGSSWQTVELTPMGNKTLLQAAVDGKKVQEIRLVNTSGAQQKVYFKRFAFGE